VSGREATLKYHGIVDVLFSLSFHTTSWVPIGTGCDTLYVIVLSNFRGFAVP
jgi:hypothetical protein